MGEWMARAGVGYRLGRKRANSRLWRQKLGALRHHNPTAWLLVLFLRRMIIRRGEWRHFFSGRMGIGGGSDIENARLDG